MEAVAERPTLLESLKTYRADQGRYVRLTAFWSLATLWGYGSFRLYQSLSDLRFEWAAWLRTHVVEEIPLLEWPLTPAMLLAALAFLLGTAAIQYALNRPKIAETLIETEAELRKVTWPTVRDTTSSSFVVLFTVVVLLVMMAGFDVVVSQIVDFLLYR